jgi:V8-like Glu-specific endopeptidase
MVPYYFWVLGHYGVAMIRRFLVFCVAILAGGITLPAHSAPTDARLSRYHCSDQNPASNPVIIFLSGVTRRFDLSSDGDQILCLREGTNELSLAQVEQLLATVTRTAMDAPVADLRPSAASLDLARAKPMPAPMAIPDPPGLPDRGPASYGEPAFDIGTDPLPSADSGSGADQKSVRPQNQRAAVADPIIDTRVKVKDTTAFPNRTIAYIAMTFPDGQVFSCTGTLVTPYVVLTAGHCIYDSRHGGYAVRVRVSPGLTAASFTAPEVFPYGNRLASSWVATRQWIAIPSADSHPLSDFIYDSAALFLPAPLPVGSSFMPVVTNQNPSKLTNAGYPGVVQGQSNNGQQWTDSGPSSLIGSSLFDVAISSSGGDSGGPFWLTGSLGPSFAGSLSAGPSDGTYDAYGPRFTAQASADVILSWMTTTPALVPETGWWWDPNVTGRGFAFEPHPTNGHVFFTAFQYAPDGRADWTYAILTPGISGTYSGDLSRVVAGKVQVLGTMSFQLSTQVAGTITWPASVGGGSLAVTRFPTNGTQLFAANYGYSAKPGWWWTPQVTGTGYEIEIQNQHLFFSYAGARADGSPVWYVATNDMTSTTDFAADLIEARGGSSYNTGATGTLTSSSPGRVSIHFTSDTTANLTLGGQTVPITKFSAF